MATIHIIIGTVNGTAWKAGQSAAVILEKLGHNVYVNEEASVSDLVRNPNEVLLVCCSTTGDGGYPRFAHAGLLLEDALYRSGAKPVGKILTIDAQVDDRPHYTAALWAKEWIDLC